VYSDELKEAPILQAHTLTALCLFGGLATLLPAASVRLYFSCLLFWWDNSLVCLLWFFGCWDVMACLGLSFPELCFARESWA
jgi:hypothetical protein